MCCVPPPFLPLWELNCMMGVSAIHDDFFCSCSTGNALFASLVSELFGGLTRRGKWALCMSCLSVLMLNSFHRSA